MFKAKSVTLAIAATLGLSSFSSHAAFFYAADGSKGTSGQLYLVNTAGTGSVLPLGSLSHSIHALALDAGGTLYGITTSRDGANSSHLVSIDPVTRAVTVISPGDQGRTTGLGFHGGTLYGARSDYRSFDTTTGVDANIGGSNPSSLASNGVDFFAVDSGSTISTINPATGATLNSGTITGRTNSSRIRGLTFDDAGTLYGIDFERNGQSNPLLSIDASNIVAGAPATAVMNLPGTILGLEAIPSASTDGDAIPDAIEPLFGLNPAADDGAGDLDGDNLTNADEVLIHGTNPNDVDSDDDGLNDDVEVALGTNPNLADTDGDGVSDGGEVALFKDPLVADDYGLNPVELTTDADNPEHFDVKTDAAGNFHMVWADGDSALKYSMLDPDGAVLIDHTTLSTFPLSPKIEPTTGGRFFVTSHDKENELYMRIIDPATAAQDGSAANPATLVTLAEAALNAGKVTHPFSLADNSGNLWAFYQDGGSSGPVIFQKILPDGTVDIAATTLDSDANSSHANIHAAVDSQNRIHVAYRHANSTSEEELYYALLDNDGTVLIAPTRITDDDGYDSVMPNLLIGPSDIVYVVWGDRGPNSSTTDGRGGELMFMTLDPALDNLNGDAADPAIIKTVTDTLVSVNDGKHSWYPRSVLRNGIITTVASNTYSQERCSNREVFKIDPASPSAGPGYKFNTANCNGNTYTIDSTIANNSVFVRQQSALGNDLIVAYPDILAVRQAAAATSTGTFSISSSEGKVIFVESLAANDLPAAAKATLPTNEVFPDGFLNFVVSGVTPGATVDVTLDLARERASFKYFKYTAAGGWAQYANVAQGTSARQYVITLTDGGAGDADGVVNGQIVDPGGLAGPAVVTPVVSRGGSSCSLNPQGNGKDPLFPLMLGAAALLWMRRKLGLSSES